MAPPLPLSLTLILTLPVNPNLGLSLIPTLMSKTGDLTIVSVVMWAATAMTSDGFASDEGDMGDGWRLWCE